MIHSLLRFIRPPWGHVDDTPSHTKCTPVSLADYVVTAKHAPWQVWNWHLDAIDIPATSPGYLPEGTQPGQLFKVQDVKLQPGGQRRFRWSSTAETIPKAQWPLARPFAEPSAGSAGGPAAGQDLYIPGQPASSKAVPPGHPLSGPPVVSGPMASGSGPAASGPVASGQAVPSSSVPSRLMVKAAPLHLVLQQPVAKAPSMAYVATSPAFSPAFQARLAMMGTMGLRPGSAAALLVDPPPAMPHVNPPLAIMPLGNPPVAVPVNPPTAVPDSPPVAVPLANPPAIPVVNPFAAVPVVNPAVAIPATPVAPQPKEASET